MYPVKFIITLSLYINFTILSLRLSDGQVYEVFDIQLNYLYVIVFCSMVVVEPHPKNTIICDHMCVFVCV